MEKPRVKLERWALSKRKLMQGTRFVLVGECTNHPAITTEMRVEKFQDPNSDGLFFITTSELLYFNYEAREAETLNSVYELGKIDPVWATNWDVEEMPSALKLLDFDHRVK